MVKSDSEMQQEEMAEAADALQQMKQMTADEISPRQIPVVDDIAPPQAEVEQLKSRLADFDFPHKLYEVVDLPLLDHCIRWNTDGTSLQIVNEAAFRKDALNLLTQGNFCSLIRQFQAYGFKKNTKSQCRHEYSHEKGHFLRAKKQDLKRISLKQTKGKALAKGTDRVEELQTSLIEIVTCIYDMCDLIVELVYSGAHAT